MKIIISGERSDGKTILSLVLHRLLQKYTQYDVSVTEEPNLTKVSITKLRMKYIDQLEPRKVDIIVSNE